MVVLLLSYLADGCRVIRTNAEGVKVVSCVLVIYKTAKISEEASTTFLCQHFM